LALALRLRGRAGVLLLLAGGRAGLRFHDGALLELGGGGFETSDGLVGDCAGDDLLLHRGERIAGLDARHAAVRLLHDTIGALHAQAQLGGGG
jgi:hypothetical protein